MRIRHFCMAILAFVIAGCSQNEITEVNPDANPIIGFNVYTGVPTRGVETTTNSMKTDGFGVIAIKAGGTDTYMTEKKVTCPSGSWIYDVPAYWPSDGTNLTFYSYAPHNKAALTNTTGTVTLPFTIDGTFANMVDLVAATTVPATAGSNVTIALKHILSRVTFAAYTAADLSGSGITVAVTDISIIGKGTNSASKFYEKGTYTYAGTTAANGTWASQTALTTDYSILSGGNVAINKHLQTEANDLLGGSYLYCIPTEAFAEGDIQVKIKYKTTANSVESEKEQTIKIPTGAGWEVGTAYKYTFKIVMNAIAFDNVTVDASWTDGTGANMEVQ